jgi:hypothetical protein
VFAATRRPYVPDAPVTFGNNDTFGTRLVNVNVVVAEHNPGAVGVRFGGAQMFLLQDVGISLADGHAGIDHNANLLQRVTVRGGQFGMLAFAATPVWQTTVLDSSFPGQQVAAIRLHTDAKLSIVRTRFADAAAADGTTSLVATLTFTAQGTRTVVEVPITVRVGNRQPRPRHPGDRLLGAVRQRRDQRRRRQRFGRPASPAPATRSPP